MNQSIATLSFATGSLGSDIFFSALQGFRGSAASPPALVLSPLYDENLIWYTPQASAKMLAGCLGY